METTPGAVGTLPKRRTFTLCASRHSMISIAFFRQRLDGKGTEKGALVLELGIETIRTLEDSLT